MVGKTAAAGVALSLAAAVLFGAVWGTSAALAGGSFGLLATGLQMGAVALVRPAVGGEAGPLFRRFGYGMGLRLLGVVAIPVAVLAARETFPPLPTALGYVLVVVPLLFYETRLFRR